MQDPLRREDLVRFAQAKLLNAQCQGCGQKDYDVLNEEDVNGSGISGRATLTVFQFPNYDITNAKAMDVCALICTNCGTLRLLGRTVVARWIAENSPPTNPNGSSPAIGKEK